MRRSPSVHNALVLNLRSDDTNLDVCGRSPPLALSSPLFCRFSLFVFLALAFPPSRPTIIIIYLSPLRNLSLLLRIHSLFPPFSLCPPSLASLAQAADAVATWLAICYSQPYAMNNCDVTPPRRKMLFPRRQRNRFLHRDDEDDDERDATTMTPMRVSFILARIMVSTVADVFTNLNPVPSIRFVRERNESTLITTASNARGKTLRFFSLSKL